jgi:glycosyltransferase involved in cell wall biosynthesis
VFDKAWFEVQTGRRFVTVAAAAHAYLQSPRGLGYSPHPLFEAEHWDPDGKNEGLVRYLATSRLWESSPHPLFDVRAAAQQLRSTRPGAATTSPWAEWVRLARPETPVPVPEGISAVTWGELRTLLLEAAREWRESREEPLARKAMVATLPPAPGLAPMRGDEPGAPLVSVILATWNRAGQLRTAIDSVLGQGYRSIELIVVDDGSTDDTRAVVEGIEAFDDRVRYVSLPRSGVSAARNAGIRAASGTYLAFLDSDNVWEPDFVGIMVATMQAQGWRVAHAALGLDWKGEPVYRATDAGRDVLLLGNFIDLNVLVTDRGLALEVGGFDETLRRAVDYDFVLKLSERETPHLVGIVGARYGELAEGRTRISVSEPATWNHVVRAKHSFDWDTATPRVEGRTSIVIPVVRDLRSILGRLELVRDRPTDRDWELVLVGFGTRAQLCCLRAASRDLPVATISRHADSHAILATAGFLASSGSIVIVCKPNAEFDASLVESLCAALDDERIAIAQPLNLAGDMTIASAGAYSPTYVIAPTPLLERHPSEDAERLGRTKLPAAWSAVVGLRATTFHALRGLDPLFANSLAEVDLSLRAEDQALGETWLIPEARCTVRPQQLGGFGHDNVTATRILQDRWTRFPPGSEELIARAGFRAAWHVPEKPGEAGQVADVVWGVRPMLVRTASPGLPDTRPRLRWAIDTAAPAGPLGDRWGDHHFAQSLAAALRRLGQDVTVDRREARIRPTRVFDDVVLTLRGLDEVHPMPGHVNLMWVISHPSAVAPWEAARYDAVFAASSTWAARQSEEWGIQVQPLLQCTDPERFNPRRAAPDTGPPVLFVGNTRRNVRLAVMYALESGARVDVYGDGWSGVIPESCIVDTFVPNDAVGALYASAGIVLNDHWDDMRRDGFLSNRLFDAVASGTRVVSDDVPGIADVFGAAVQVFRSPADMRRLLTEPHERHFPDQASRRAAARRIAAQHSFDARAATLLETALGILAGRAVEEPVRQRPPQIRRW